MGQDPKTGQQIPHATLWPGAMAILAGIDLLGKFYAGDDQIGQVGKRFCDFIHKYFQPISAGDEDIIYQLRNALLHSFGLYSESKGKKYRFVLGQNLGHFITAHAGDIYVIDIRELHRQFETAISNYQNDVDTNTKFQTHFTVMFPKYGAIKIG